MALLITRDLFRRILNLNASKEHLSIIFFFQDHSKPSRHIDDISIWIIIYILSGVFASVSIYIFKLIIRIWRSLVHRRMVIWFSYCSNPRLHSPKLLDLNFNFFFFKFKEITFRTTIFNLFSGHNFFSFLIDCDPFRMGILIKFGSIFPYVNWLLNSGRLCLSRLCAAHICSIVKLK